MTESGLISELNAVYERFEKRLAELLQALADKKFEAAFGWYNNHYVRTDDDGWRRDAYPIPVIAVKGICDIEIQPDGVSLSTKLSRETALSYDYGGIIHMRFEAYGVDDYLADYYHEGMTTEALKSNISKCGEREIGFSFVFPSDTDERELCELVEFLRREGFHS